MAGRGPLSPDGAHTRPPDPRIRVWREAEGGWRPAAHPLHNNSPKGAVGPGLAFAQAVLPRLEADAVIGLVPAAEGGSSIARWCPASGDLFQAAVGATRAALAAAEAEISSDSDGASNWRVDLAGILWHQGESDAVSAELAGAYLGALRELVCALPAACGAPDAPFILGELGMAFLDSAQGGRFAHAHAINGYIGQVAAEAARAGARVGVVSARGLVDRGDRLHFATAAAELLGRRYAHRWLRLCPAHELRTTSCAALSAFATAAACTPAEISPIARDGESEPDGKDGSLDPPLFGAAARMASECTPHGDVLKQDSRAQPEPTILD